MVTNQSIANNFNWGDSVSISKNFVGLPLNYKIGGVCGFREIDSDMKVNGLIIPKGAILYLIEFNDGQDMEIPEQFLSAID